MRILGRGQKQSETQAVVQFVFFRFRFLRVADRPVRMPSIRTKPCGSRSTSGAEQTLCDAPLFTREIAARALYLLSSRDGEPL